MATAGMLITAAMTLAMAMTAATAAGQTQSAAAPTALPARLIPPERGAYTGAYIDFGEGEDHVTRAALDQFTQTVGKHQAIIGSSSYWGRGNFPAENVRLIDDYGAVPLLYWSPWGPPYEQEPTTKPDQFSLAHIVAGDCDAYIDRWAAGAREFGKPLLVSFACEPNSDWFPWSGWANGGAKAEGETKAEGGLEPQATGRGARATTRKAEGGDEKDDGGDTRGLSGPELYVRAYRHAVDRVRAAGARNVAWVFHANSDSVPEKKWNAMRAYYPGPDYVDWLGMSVYGQLTPGNRNKGDWQDWEDTMDEPYRALCALDPTKPVMLAEWGVGEFPESGDKAEYLRDAFAAMNGGKYPRLKAAVFWHERWQNSDESYSNLRVDSSPGALKAFRQGEADAFWVEKAEENEK